MLEASVEVGVSAPIVLEQDKEQLELPLPEPQKTIQELTEASHSDLIETLEGFGNELDPQTEGGRKHQEALKAVLECYSTLALTRQEGRYAFPLSVGLGKTQSIASWCGQVHRRGLQLSVLVCQERIESLIELYEALLGKGIPAEKIGLLHYKGKDSELPSIRAEDAPQYQFLLLSHAKIKSGRDIEALNVWEDCFEGFAGRSLCIWDESLIRTEGRAAIASQLEKDYACVSTHANGLFRDQEAHCNPMLQAALDYLRVSLLGLKDGFTDRDTNGEPTIAKLERLEGGLLESYMQAIKEACKTDKSAAASGKQLVRFLEISQEELRLVSLGQGNQGNGAITYLPKVPDELSRVVVLDASHHVRELTSLDTSIQTVSGYEDAKDFSNVKVTQHLENGGKYTLNKLRVDNPYLQKVVQVVNAAPEGEAVLIVTHKPRSERGVMNTLKCALEEAGVDPPEESH